MSNYLVEMPMTQQTAWECRPPWRHLATADEFEVLVDLQGVCSCW